MRLLPFVPPPAPVDPDEPPCYTDLFLSVTVRKGSRTIHYRVTAGVERGTCQTWVRWNGRPHRALLCRSRYEAEQLRAEFDREIAALLEDGWSCVSAGAGEECPTPSA